MTKIKKSDDNSNYDNKICIVSSHFYAGKTVTNLMLKGRDLILYKWLKQYFNVYILPLILINSYLKNQNGYDYSDIPDKWFIRFGRLISSQQSDDKIVYEGDLIEKELSIQSTK